MAGHRSRRIVAPNAEPGPTSRASGASGHASTATPVLTQAGLERGEIARLEHDLEHPLPLGEKVRDA